MLTDPKLRAEVDAFWDRFLTEGLANICEPPLDMFGADEVERWFTEKEVKEVVEFAKKLEL